MKLDGPKLCLDEKMLVRGFEKAEEVEGCRCRLLEVKAEGRARK